MEGHLKLLLKYCEKNVFSKCCWFRFSKFDPAVHEGALQDLKSGGTGGRGSVGEGEYRNRKSYMTTGSLTIFSDMPEVQLSDRNRKIKLEIFIPSFLTQ